MAADTFTTATDKPTRTTVYLPAGLAKRFSARASLFIFFALVRTAFFENSVHDIPELSVHDVILKMGGHLMPVCVLEGREHHFDGPTEMEPAGPTGAFHECVQALDHRLFQSIRDHAARGRRAVSSTPWPRLSSISKKCLRKC